MKTKIRILISVLLALVMLIPALSIVVGAQDNSVTISADELFDLFFAEEEQQLTTEERAYLASNTALLVVYSTDDVANSNVTYENVETAGTLKITAKEVQKIVNGITVSWTPVTVCVTGGKAKEFNKNESNNSYTYTYDEQWQSGAIEFTVEYVMSLSIPEAVLNRILTADIDAVVAKRTKIISDFNTAKGNYNTYKNELAKYPTKHDKWVIDKQAYDDYVTQKEAYDKRVSDYNTLAAQWQAYNDYQTALGEYETKSQQYTAYKATMDKVDACLAIMDSMFSDTEEGEYNFYQSLIGKSEGDESDLVISNFLDQLTSAPANSVLFAKSAINTIKSNLTAYNEKRTATYESDFEKKAALFQQYKDIYIALATSVASLYGNLDPISSNPTVQAEMETLPEAGVSHFQEFLTQLSALNAQLGAEQANQTNLAFPSSYLEEPVAPSPVVTEPEEQLPETNPADEPAPTAVKDPGEEPVAPPEVADPGEAPDLTQLSAQETALLAKYDAGELPERSKKTGAKTYRFDTVTKSITKNVDYKNIRTVIFLNEHGNQKGATITLEYGETIPVESRLPKLTDPSDLKKLITDAKTYECDGWCVTTNKTELFDLGTPITSNIMLAPHYKETWNEYTVKWEVDGKIVKQEKVRYGDMPTKPETPTKPDNGEGNYKYLFKGWSPSIKPVDGDITYVAEWRESPRVCNITWVLWGTNKVVVSVNNGAKLEYQNGATPQRPDDGTYSYEFLKWTPDVEEVATKHEIYTAIWTRTPLNQQAETYTVTWNFNNGAAPVTEQLITGTVPEYGGIPTKPSDAQYTYKFDGWDPTPVAVTSDATYTAKWKKTLREYTITWDLNYEGSTPKTETLKYGDLPNYGETPTRAAEGDTVYTFIGWTPTIAKVTGDATYTAKWTTDTTRYTITWNVAGKEMTAQYYRGETPAYEGTPTKDQDEQYTYEFDGWDQEIVPVDGDATYTAKWKDTLREYTVTWVVAGKETTAQVAYGTVPTYQGTPKKAATAQTIYSFDYWDPAPVAVTGDATYTAKWKEAPREYTITWNLNYEGSTPKTETLKYGDLPNYGETPTRAADGQYSYEFDGWDPALTKVTGNKTYTAKWKTGQRSFDITWDLGYGESATSTVEVMNGETPTPPTDTPTRPDDESFSYTFVDWSPEIVPATAAATYTATWKKVPLVTDAEGKTHPTQIVGETVVVDAAKNELVLKPVIDFAAEENKTVTLERGETKIVLQAKLLKEQLPGLYRIRWTEDAKTESFRVEFVDSAGKALETGMTYQVTIPTVADTRELNVYYELDDGTMTKIVCESEPTTNRLTYTAQVGKKVVYKTRYKLILEGTYFSNPPEFVEAGEKIDLTEVKCATGFEVVGATLVHENETTEKIDTSFTMPSESVTVKLEIKQIEYHIVFMLNDVILSEKYYHYGENIEVPADPTLPDDGEYKYVFAGWGVSKTVAGDAREQVYKAKFIPIPNNLPQEEEQTRFVDSPAFAVLIMVLIVGALVAGAVVAAIIWMKKKPGNR